MDNRLPPLNALRCFEAAARQDNFTLAADELCLTPSAVSHQIRLLENYLGMPLFNRTGRRMVLTESGRIYFGLIKRSLDDIVVARALVERRSQSQTLCIGTPPDFATSWLMPRLSAFVRRYNNIRIELVTSPNENGLIERKLDLEIRYGHGKWPTLKAVHLMDDHLVPVCSPSLLANGAPLIEPKDILNYTLIYTGNRPVNWRDWAAQFGVESIKEANSIHVDRCALARHAAIAGVGIALESMLSATAAVAAGDLIVPLPEFTYDEEAYYLVYPKSGIEPPQVAAFRMWLQENIAAEKGSVDMRAPHNSRGVSFPSRNNNLSRTTNGVM
jgi:LysR family glycine cleavage system transcriptional activator